MRFLLFGFPIRVHPAFWFVSLLLSGMGGGGSASFATAIAWIAIVFVSIVVHELGHAFAMRALGREPSIELVGFGGATTWGDGPRVPPVQVALVSLAGPFAGFVFGIPFAIAWFTGHLPEDAFARDRIHDLLFVNFGWGLVNLLPMLPLDGGRVSECVGFAMFGRNGARASYVLSIVVAAGVVLLSIRFGLVFFGIIAAFSIASSWKLLRRESVDPSIPARKTYVVDEETESAVQDAWQTIERGSARDAIALCEARWSTLAEGPEGDPARAILAETLAWAHLEDGDEDAALAARARMPEGMRPSALLEARLLIASGRTEEGLAALDRVVLESQGDRAAIVAAAAWRDAGRPERSVDLLHGHRGATISLHAHRLIEASLYYDDCFEEALAVSELIFDRFNEPASAYNAACSLVRLDRMDEAFRWLEKALAAGYRDAEQLLSDVDLAPLRGDERFEAIAARIPREG